MSFGAFKPAAPANPADLLAELQPPKAKPAGKFVPGKKGKPRSGVTAHEIVNNPDTFDRLHAMISEHEATTGLKAKGPQVHKMLQEVVGADVSYPQALTVRRKFDKIMKRRVVGHG